MRRIFPFHERACCTYLSVSHDAGNVHAPCFVLHKRKMRDRERKRIKCAEQFSTSLIIFIAARHLPACCIIMCIIIQLRNEIWSAHSRGVRNSFTICSIHHLITQKRISLAPNCSVQRFVIISGFRTLRWLFSRTSLCATDSICRSFTHTFVRRGNLEKSLFYSMSR
jgi:hypothetical protein